MMMTKKKFGFHNFAEHRLRTSGLISFRVKISIRSTGYPRSCVRTYAESCLAASWQSGPWERQRSCGIKGFPLSPTAGADLPREASCVGDHTYGLSRDRRAPKHSRMILARRQSETNANLINQKAPDNSHAFCFPFSLSLSLSLFFYLCFCVHAICISLPICTPARFCVLVVVFLPFYYAYGVSLISCFIEERARVEADGASWLDIFGRWWKSWSYDLYTGRYVLLLLLLCIALEDRKWLSPRTIRDSLLLSVVLRISGNRSLLTKRVFTFQRNEM